MPNKVILLGTIAGNMWREGVMHDLKARGIRDDQIFNPVVEHWTPELKEMQDQHIADSNYLLVIVLASPNHVTQDQQFVSAYSLWEAAKHIYDDQYRTVVFFNYDRLDKRSAKGLRAVEKEIAERHPHAVLVNSYTQLVDAIIQRIEPRFAVEEAIELLEETDYGYNHQGFLKGLQLLAKYDQEIIPEFDHDICWASAFEKTVPFMSDAEIIQMKKEFGWDYDDENECWSHR